MKLADEITLSLLTTRRISRARRLSVYLCRGLGLYLQVIKNIYKANSDYTEPYEEKLLGCKENSKLMHEDRASFMKRMMLNFEGRNLDNVKTEILVNY